MKRTPIKRKTPLRAKKKPRKVTKRAKKPKKPSIRILKDKLWRECRRIIIERHGTTCYTCGSADLAGSGLHIGHFIPSSVCSAQMRYDLENLRPQCFACNIHRSGNWVVYERHLLADGVDVSELKQRNEDTKGQQYDAIWYQKMIDDYRSL